MIINRSLLDDVKMYSSSERRVLSTAHIFAEKFLEIDLSPAKDLITISKEMLDDSNAAKEQMDSVKSRLQAILNRQEDYEFLNNVITNSHGGFNNLLSSSAVSSPHILGINGNGLTTPSPYSITTSSSSSTTDLSSYSPLPSAVLTPAPPTPSRTLSTSAGVNRNYGFFGPPRGLGNPADLVDEVIDLMSQLRLIMNNNFKEKDVGNIQTKWCCFENPGLFKVNS